MAKVKRKTVYRSSITGRFVKERRAKKNLNTTERERVIVGRR